MAEEDGRREKLRNMMIESSPSSAGSASFRELDEVFLQTQTRIWIGEVLQTRLDDDVQLSDLLQDGEILLEVSKVLWNRLLSKCMELKHLKHKYGPFGSRKNSGRYRPYSNVDSFLKLCKILGMSGIDLFSPSDVVEKRDIRKVCICIRALSKKTRSKQLRVVPDFDVVIPSVTMPTNMVGGIKKSLESSQLSSPSSLGSCKGSNMELKQATTLATPNRDEDSSSEASDEAESRYMGDTSFSPDRENSPEEFARHVRTEKCHCTDESVERPCNNDSPASVGDSSCIVREGRGEENNYIEDYLAFSDLMVHATDGNSSTILDGENSNMFDFFLKVDSNQGGLASDRMSSKYGKSSNEEDIDEVSSTTSMSSVLGRLLTMEFEDQKFSPDCNDSCASHDDDEEQDAKDKTGPATSSLSSKNSSQSAEDVEITNQGEEEDDGESRNCEDIGSNTDHESENNDPSLQENRISTSTHEHDNSSPTDPNSELVKGSEVVSGKKETGKKGFGVRKEQVIKTVVKGTAIAGVLFLLIHIRNSRGGNERETSVNARAASKTNRSRKPSAAENRPGNGIYPADRLKF